MDFQLIYINQSSSAFPVVQENCDQIKILHLYQQFSITPSIQQEPDTQSTSVQMQLLLRARKDTVDIYPGHV